MNNIFHINQGVCEIIWLRDTMFVYICLCFQGNILYKCRQHSYLHRSWWWKTIRGEGPETGQREDLRSARTQYFCTFVGQREDLRSARTQYFCTFVGQREDLRSARTKYFSIFKIDALSAKCIQFGVKPILSNKYKAEASSMTLRRVPRSGAPRGRGGGMTARRGMFAHPSIDREA